MSEERPTKRPRPDPGSDLFVEHSEVRADCDHTFWSWVEYLGATTESTVTGYVEQTQQGETAGQFNGVEVSATVCFGEVVGLLGSYETTDAIQQVPGTSFQVRLISADQFLAADNDAIKGKIHADYTHLTDALIQEPDIELQITCSCDIPQVLDTQKPRAAKTPFQSIPCSLSIIIYGPQTMFADIGIFFQECEVYLQDPQGCDRNVKYCNPHRLSSTDQDTCPWTSDLIVQNMTGQTAEMTTIDVQPDLLDTMDAHENLPEAPQPNAIRTRLEKHQRQALTFMCRREQGWAWKAKGTDIWEFLDTGRSHYFINRVSGSHHTEQPEDFYGGIIADPMGLGKTLTMIALVATDLERLTPFSMAANMETTSSHQTLIVVPPALLGTWEEQLTEHVVHGGLTWCRHHGKTRVSRDVGFQAKNIILTTYHTVSAEWRSRKQLEPSVLFTTRWARVILDEAHLIRNSTSQMTSAICDLMAVSRWAVTGTPIQNKLSDLGTLLTFIRAHPYSDKKQFEADISRLWKDGETEEAVNRLKRLAGCLILRRRKSIINLPPRRDLRCSVKFTASERAMYDKIRNQVVSRLDDLLAESHESKNTQRYVNALQQIEAMRMVCNLGIHYRNRHQQPQGQAGIWKARAQQTFNLKFRMGEVWCRYCNGLAEVVDNPPDDAKPAMFSQCMHFVCSECTPTARPCDCENMQTCSYATVSLSPDKVAEDTVSVAGLAMEAPQSLALGLPSKVSTLIARLQALPLGTKSIVFSTWRTTLDVIEMGLGQALIPSLRFDGKVQQKDRQGVIDRFRQDLEIRVLLLTLSCGAVGLTLTAASYAFLMEPHWNPTLEDQALARIHRLGQKQEVTTIRFCMEGSFEQHVVEIQEKKRTLANILIRPDESSATGLDLKSLENLRNLL